MEIVYNLQALEDIASWKETGNIKVQLKISALINNIAKTPFVGIGKPEPLKII
jgi:toxin YoeB